MKEISMLASDIIGKMKRENKQIKTALFLSLIVNVMLMFLLAEILK